MHLVEQHRIDRHDLRWAAIDVAAFASKNLYNAALYLTRQAYLKAHTVSSSNALDTLMQPAEQYRLLPAKPPQCALNHFSLACTTHYPPPRPSHAHPQTPVAHPTPPNTLPKH